MSLKNRESYFQLPTSAGGLIGCFSMKNDDANIDCVQIAEFPASEAFDAINAVLQGSEEDRKDAIKQGGAVFAFTLKNKAGKTDSWHIDLKEKGVVGKGVGEKPTGEYYWIHLSKTSSRWLSIGLLTAGLATWEGDGS